MPASLDGQLVVALSSRALFDFEEENRVFEDQDDSAYMRLQLERMEQPARPGVAFPLVQKLLAFNTPERQRVAVVILSRNDPVSGLRIFKSADAAGLQLERGVFTRGRPPFHYLKPLGANLFLSANEADVRAALEGGFPAARVYSSSLTEAEKHPQEVRIAFDGDAVLFSDEAERVFQEQGLAAFQDHEERARAAPAAARPVPAPARSPAPPARRQRRMPDAHPHRAGHRAQRPGPRTRDPHPDGMEGRASTKPCSSAAWRSRASSANSNPTSSSTTRQGTASRRHGWCRRDMWLVGWQIRDRQCIPEIRLENLLNTVCY
jgi:hypothetical protein